jgi:hypothetical protein
MHTLHGGIERSIYYFAATLGKATYYLIETARNKTKIPAAKQNSKKNCAAAAAPSPTRAHVQIPH